MPLSKNQLLRINIIDRCLSGQQKYWTRAELLEKLEESDIYISSRSLDSDIDVMRNDARLGYFAPIKYCRYKGAYHYTVDNYSISRLDITPELERSMIVTQFLAEQCGDHHMIKFARPMIEALSRLIGVSVSACYPNHRIIEFQSTASKGLEFFGQIFDAIREKKVLLVKLGTMADQLRKHTVHPYVLKEVNHEWFLVGYNETLKKLSAIRLNTVRSIHELTDAWYVANDIQEWDVFSYLLC